MTTGGGRRLSSADAWAPILAALAVLITTITVFTPQPAGVFWDDGVYLLTARSLAHGDGYRLAHLPGAPAAVHFPPVWPALLALVWMAAPEFPANLNWFRLLNPLLAATGAGLACAYAMHVLRLPRGVAVVATAGFALMLPVLVLASVLFAEPLFFVALLGALYAADRTARDGGWRAAVIVGVAVGVTALVRSAGLVLVPAVAIALVVARRRREAIVSVATALAMLLPWQVWSALHARELAEPLRGSYGPYLPWLADAVRERGASFVAAVVALNATSLERTVAIVFFPVGLRDIRPLLVALLALIGALGLAAAWQRARTLACFLVLYAALILVWPYAPDRFAWAVWPLVGAVMGAGAVSAWRMATRSGAPPGERMAAGLLVVVALLAASGGAFYTGRGISRGWADIAQRRTSDQLVPIVEWVRAHTPADAVIASDGEPLVHLYTQRRVVPVHILSPDEYLAGTPLGRRADDLQTLLRASGADFAVMSAGAVEIEAAALLRDGTGFPRLTPIDTLPGGGVAFRVIRGAPPTPIDATDQRTKEPHSTRRR